jgi:hypothetical protein
VSEGWDRHWTAGTNTVVVSLGVTLDFLQAAPMGDS